MKDMVAVLERGPDSGLWSTGRETEDGSEGGSSRDSLSLLVMGKGLQLGCWWEQRQERYADEGSVGTQSHEKTKNLVALCPRTLQCSALDGTSEK